MQIDKDNLSVALITQAEFQIRGIKILAASHFEENDDDCFQKIGNLIREEIYENSSCNCNY